MGQPPSYLVAYLGGNLEAEIRSLLSGRLAPTVRVGGGSFTGRSAGDTVISLPIGTVTAGSLILLGEAFLAAASLVVMMRIDVKVTAIVFLPLVVVVVLSNRAMKSLQTNREVSREATSQVIGSSASSFALSTTTPQASAPA